MPGSASRLFEREPGLDPILLPFRVPFHIRGAECRRIVLPVSQTSGVATVTLPADPNVLPLGHYMIFAMVDDIPSVARILNIVPS